ncbi:MAG: hypothetical protein LC789_06550 [Actinobacteria bacterium]|nr:hypothetical protein [Actinomycetota bacterium]MCA1720563.1 hypothetical protein [Actinomycetota bacterium]
MTRTSKALKRLGVAGLVAVTVGAGLPALVATSAQAAGPVTKVTITSTDNQAAAGSCLAVTAQATDASGVGVPGATITVSISDSSTSGTQDVNFCTAPTGTTQPQTGTVRSAQGPTASGGSTDTSTFTADQDGNITFGVTAIQPGSVFIRAFYDRDNNGQFSAGEPQDTRTVQFTSGGAPGTNTNQDAANSVTVTPKTDSSVVGETRTFIVTVLNSSGDALTGVRVSYQTAPGATNQGQSFTATECGSTNNDGQAICRITFTQVGTDNLVFFVQQTGATSTSGFDPATEPSDTATEMVSAVPTGRSVTLSPDNRNVDFRTTSATYTATVNNTGSGNTASTSGTLLSFTVSGGSGDETVTRECTTGTAGTNGSSSCVVTVTDPTPVSGEVLTITATIRGTNNSDTATLTFTNVASDARNIVLTPKTQTVTPGSGVGTLSAKVTDVNGSPVQGVLVTFTESGPGRFVSPNNGADSTQVLTNAQGIATVELVSQSGESGTTTVTASIANQGNQCTAATGKNAAGTTLTGNNAGAAAGNCTDTATVTFGTAQSPTATPSSTVSPSTGPNCDAVRSNLPVKFMVQQGRVGQGAFGPVANATQLVTVTITGATPNRVVELEAYQQNHFGTASFTSGAANTRTATADANGVATLQVRFSSNARARARMQGCAFGRDAGFNQGTTGANSNVLYVKTVITFTVTRVGPKTLRISGDSLPARPGGLIVNIDCTDARCKSASNPNGILLQPRANSTTGEFGPVDYAFKAFSVGQRVTLYATTGDPATGKGDAQNIAGRSNDRSVLLS